VILKCQESSFATGFAGQHSAGQATGHSAGKATVCNHADSLPRSVFILALVLIIPYFFIH
jgi:hypothetical protein